MSRGAVRVEEGGRGRRIYLPPAVTGLQRKVSNTKACV